MTTTPASPPPTWAITTATAYPPSIDCDDTDPNVTSTNVDDADCDGVPSSVDCDDTDLPSPPPMPVTAIATACPPPRIVMTPMLP